jgi:hypothetical protein
MNISVLVVDQGMDHSGLLTNAAFVLGLTAGRQLPHSTFGDNVFDGDGHGHTYLTQIAHIVRKAGQNKIRNLRQLLADQPNVVVIDYTEDAATADYREYARNLSGHAGEEIRYQALYIYGPEEIVAPLTKNLSWLS